MFIKLVVLLLVCVLHQNLVSPNEHEDGSQQEQYGSYDENNFDKNQPHVRTRRQAVTQNSKKIFGFQIGT